MKKFISLLIALVIFVAPMTINAETTNVAKIGETEYATLEEAINVFDSEKDSEIKLIGNVTSSGMMIITKDVTINLNSYNISAPTKVFEVQRGNFTVTGTGIIEETQPQNAVIRVKGSINANDLKHTVVNLGSGVTLRGYTGVLVTYVSSANQYAYGVEVNTSANIISVNSVINGTVGSAININGTIQHLDNGPVININGGNYTSKGTGLYLAGYAETTINNLTLTANELGVGIKAGKLVINNANITVTGDDLRPVDGWSNGINPSGAAIQIESNPKTTTDNSGYAGNIDITINNGKFISNNGVTVYEYYGDANETTTVKNFVVKGGTFISDLQKGIFDITPNFLVKHPQFITGGSYNMNPGLVLVDSYKANLNEDNLMYVVKKEQVVAGKNTVSGTITNGANATVQLKQGALVIDTVKANANGEYKFVNIANGQYNVVASFNDTSTSKLVEVNKNVVVNLKLADGSVNIIVVGDKTPNVVVGGLENIDPDKNIIFGVQLIEENKKDTTQNKLKDVMKVENYEFFDITIGINDGIVSEINNILSIILPYDLTGKNNIKLAHYHENKVIELIELDKLPEAGKAVDGTYYVDYENNLIYIYSKKYSTFAIGYDEVNNKVNQTIPTTPKTGDNILLYTVLGILSLTGIAVVSKKSYNN